MSFPVLPTDTTTSALVEPSPPDSAPYVPVPHTTDTPTPRRSVWALISAICGVVTAVGVGVAIFSIIVAGVLCVAAGPALVCGLVGLVSISESHGRLKGRGLAVVGVVMGFVGLLILTRMMSMQLSSHLPTHLFPTDD